MHHPRLSIALEGQQLSLPSEGKIAVFHPTAGTELSDLPKDRVQIVQPFKPDYDAFRRLGYDCLTEAGDDFAAALVQLPRAKALAKEVLALASLRSDLVIVDGQKTDGIDSILKECRKRASIEGVVSKAHGKLFWFRDGDFSDWRAPERNAIEGGFVTRAGVFSADGIDPASQALAAVLPAKLGKNVADLGAGWGYLSQSVLGNEMVESAYLVEADHIALQCARENIADPRAHFVWADARDWVFPVKMNTVVMNPPFHVGRSADPALGRSFITAAAKMLAPNGTLWMVANRHLPYEAHLSACFAKVEEVAGDNRFKVFRAERPSRKIS